MKKTRILFALSAILLLGISSCGKGGCTDKNAFNYNSSATKDDGTCISIGTEMTGVYSGTLFDSVSNGAGNTYSNYQYTVVKLSDNSIQLFPPTNAISGVNFKAGITSQGNSVFSLSIAPQSYGTDTIIGGV